MLEPDLANIRQAEKYFALIGGKPQNVEIVPAGLWKTNGVLKFAAGLGSASSVIEAGQEVPPDCHLTEIPVESLESLAQKYNLSRLDLVKLDIEGAEVEVVETSANIVKRFHPKFSIASYHLRGTRKTSEIITPLFHDLSYHVQTGFPVHQTTWAAPIA